MSDSAATIATDPSAPAAERYDATVAVTNSLRNALLPADEVMPMVNFINEQMAEQAMMKASHGANQNVIKGPWSARQTAPGPQSVMLDDFQLFAQGQYWDRPGVLGFDSMRAMVDQTPILNAIILTRIRQVKRFCRPQTPRNRAGFMIEHIDDKVELARLCLDVAADFARVAATEAAQ